MGKNRNAYRLLVGKPERNRRPRYWRVDNITSKMDLGEIGLGGVNWIDLAQDKDRLGALVNAVMNIPVSSNAGNLLIGCTTGGLSSSAQLHKIS
jgi:hypothetical protein